MHHKEDKQAVQLFSQSTSCSSLRDVNLSLSLSKELFCLYLFQYRLCPVLFGLNRLERKLGYCWCSGLALLKCSIICAARQPSPPEELSSSYPSWRNSVQSVLFLCRNLRAHTELLFVVLSVGVGGLPQQDQSWCAGLLTAVSASRVVLYVLVSLSPGDVA